MAMMRTLVRPSGTRYQQNTPRASAMLRHLHSLGPQTMNIHNHKHQNVPSSSSPPSTYASTAPHSRVHHQQCMRVSPMHCQSSTSGFRSAASNAPLHRRSKNSDNLHFAEEDHHDAHPRRNFSASISTKHQTSGAYSTRFSQLFPPSFTEESVATGAASPVRELSTWGQKKSHPKNSTRSQKMRPNSLPAARSVMSPDLLQLLQKACTISRSSLAVSLSNFVIRRKFSAMPNEAAERKKVTVKTLKSKFEKNEKITMCTAYDCSSANFVEAAGIDMILVGDSLGMVMLGRNGTETVTMEEMIHHCKAVMSSSKKSMVVGDMPFGTYEISAEEAARNAVRLVKESGVHAVKLEGPMAEQIRAITKVGIPVVAHVGLTPQRKNELGGFVVQGKDAISAKRILEEAQLVQDAGAFMVVLEGIPEKVAAYITKKLKVPTIGIGAGKDTSGQVLVYHDLLGLYSDFVPKFTKQYLSLKAPIVDALSKFRSEVESVAFPAKEHVFTINKDELLKAFADFDQIVQPNKTSEAPSQHPVALSASMNPQQTAMDMSPDFDQIVQRNKSNSAAASLDAPKPSIHIIQQDEKKKKIAVIGGGAMGSLLSAYLATDPKNKICMISSWKEHVNHINQNGLYLTQPESDKSNPKRISLNAAGSVDEAMNFFGDYADLAMIMVKSPNTKEAAVSAHQLIGKKGLVLSLQNGLGNRDVILQQIGDQERVINGVTSHGSMIQTGHVFHTGKGRTSLAYETSNKLVVEEIARMLTSVGIDTELNENLDSTLWGKLVVSAGINPLTALLKVRNGFLIENENCNKLFSKTVLEAAKVADALGIRLPFENPLERAFQVAKQTSENFSSMYWDVVRNRPTEIDSINGAIVTRGTALGCDVQTNRTLTDLIQSSFLKN